MTVAPSCGVRENSPQRPLSTNFQSPGLKSPGLQSSGLQSPGLKSPGLQSPGLKSSPSSTKENKLHHLSSVQISGSRVIDVTSRKQSSSKNSPSPNSATKEEYFFPADKPNLDNRRPSLTDGQDFMRRQRSSISPTERESLPRRQDSPNNNIQALQNRRNSDSFSLTKVRKLQQKLNEPKRSLQHDVDFFNHRNSQNGWSNGFSSISSASEDSSSKMNRSRQDISSLFGSYSSLVNLTNQRKSISEMPAKLQHFSSKNFGFRNNNIAYEGPALQCLSPAYATISSSAYRELTQKVK